MKKLIVKIIVIFLSLPILSCEKEEFDYNYPPEYIQELRARYDDIILDIAYSSLNDNRPINTLEHFEAAVQYGFNALKTDVRLTKDGELVLCHDPGFTLNSEERITSYDSHNHRKIRDMMLREVLSLEHEAYHEHLGYHAHPATLKDFLSFCAENDVIPYITIRNEYEDETVSKIKGLLETYDFTDRAIINNYPPSLKTCKTIRKYLPYISISYTSGIDIVITKEWIETVDALGNAVLCVQRDRLADMSETLWAYTEEKGLRIFGCEIREKADYDLFISKGCKGFQILKKEVISE